jgi:hypothetical protein
MTSLTCLESQPAPQSRRGAGLAMFAAALAVAAVAVACAEPNPTAAADLARGPALAREAVGPSHFAAAKLGVTP